MENLQMNAWFAKGYELVSEHRYFEAVLHFNQAMRVFNDGGISQREYEKILNFMERMRYTEISFDSNFFKVKGQCVERVLIPKCTYASALVNGFKKYANSVAVKEIIFYEYNSCYQFHIENLAAWLGVFQAICPNLKLVKVEWYNELFYEMDEQEILFRKCKEMLQNNAIKFEYDFIPKNQNTSSKVVFNTGIVIAMDDYTFLLNNHPERVIVPSGMDHWYDVWQTELFMESGVELLDRSFETLANLFENTVKIED